MENPIFNEVRDDVKTILNVLNGNGKMGLVAKVSVMWGAGIFVVSGVVVTLIKVFIMS